MKEYVGYTKPYLVLNSGEHLPFQALSLGCTDGPCIYEAFKLLDTFVKVRKGDIHWRVLPQITQCENGNYEVYFRLCVVDHNLVNELASKIN